MSLHFYAFGSICRGEIDFSSDIDLLACVSTPTAEIDPTKFSIYTYQRINELWLEGNPFAWHLYLEARLLYTSDGLDFLMDLGKPSPYTKALDDCTKFHNLFLESRQSLMLSNNSAVFNLSCMFLAMRNFATCYSLKHDMPVFSRKSPLLIDQGLPINSEVFEIFSRARILSTRGYGSPISALELMTAKESMLTIINWMQNIISTGGIHE